MIYGHKFDSRKVGTAILEAAGFRVEPMCDAIHPVLPANPPTHYPSPGGLAPVDYPTFPRTTVPLSIGSLTKDGEFIFNHGSYPVIRWLHECVRELPKSLD